MGIMWEIRKYFEIPTNLSSHRVWPIVTPINSSEIVVLGGGYDGQDYPINGFIFNTRDKSFSKVTTGFKFDCSGNSSALIGHNKLGALV